MSATEQLSLLNCEAEVILGNRDYSNPKLATTLKKAKIAIYSHPDLENQSQAYLKQATKFADLNLMFTLGTRNNQHYEQAINTVRFFEENWGGDIGEERVATAIQLLFLLSTNRTQEFYSRLESMPSAALQGKHVQYVLKLNDAIEEGNYRKVLALGGHNPLPDYFGPFLDRISETIRHEMAKSAEKAYAQLTVVQAISLFQLNSEQELRAFAASYQEAQEDSEVNWQFRDGGLFFERKDGQRTDFNSEELIRKTLDYSCELERIA